MDSGPRASEIGKGILIGAVSGLVGIWAMTEFQTWWSKRDTQGHPDKGTQGTPESEHQDPATEKVADAIGGSILGRQLSPQDRKTVGNAVHYATGVIAGAGYGGAAEMLPQVTTGSGTAFGTAVWLVGDSALVPALGLAKPASKQRASARLYGFLAHVVYGFSTEMTRRMLRVLF